MASEKLYLSFLIFFSLIRGLLVQKRSVGGVATTSSDGMPNPDSDIDFILDERARELAGELRWFDLKRTGKLGDRIERYNPDITEFQEYHNLRPIPLTELDWVTNDDFRQNSRY